MKIISYSPEYKNDFIEMNRLWISQMFEMETEDERELDNVESYIDKGGQIFFALDDENRVEACCMIAPRDDGDWEIMKFAAKGMYTGTGAGSAAADHRSLQAVRRLRKRIEQNRPGQRYLQNQPRRRPVGGGGRGHHRGARKRPPLRGAFRRTL